ncbi:hypothetical protein [Pilimelia columellifera]|uniref:Uncharacterized protein n=1 Tax=Pilimelia columellifera subsp. columellifera TaxID=706583 RepID=A0ABN3NAG2_9ACTN
MVVASLALILVAIVLVVIGLASSSGGVLMSSIAVSLLAAAALFAGVRQTAASRRMARASRPATPVRDRPGGGHDLSPGVKARLAALPDAVAVTDAPLSFHLPNCARLPPGGFRLIPVATAAAAGIRPCHSCDPAAALLASLPRS